MKCRRRLFPIMIVLAVMILTSGCFGVPATSSSVTQGSMTFTETSETSALPDDCPTAPSGLLRLWWSVRSSLNPLIDSSESGMAASRLVFGGLFQIDGNQQIQSGLAEEIRFDAGGLSADLTLAEGRVFHDGTAVTAADVKACIDFIFNNAGVSGYAAGLKTIERVEVIDDRSLRLFLNQPDYWLAYRLTFPVLPEKSLQAEPFDLIPGTGIFRMEAYEPGQKLTLVRADVSNTSSTVKVIHLLEFANFNDAMKAFEDDRIDLVQLPSPAYKRYILRDSLRFGQYIGDEAVILAYNTRQKHLLSDPARLIYLKQLLAASSLGVSSASGASTGVAVTLDSFLLSGTGYTEDVALDSLGSGEWKTVSGQLVILAPAGDSQRSELAGLIGSRLDQDGIIWQIRLLPADEFAEALQAGDYDLALLNVTLPAEPDPTWLYSDNRQISFAALGSITAGGLENYAAWYTRLQASITLAAMRGTPDADVLARNLYETAVRSPWSVLLIRSAAILYGDRVVGQSTPDRYNPYKGIEELWIWSGQSS